MRTTVYLRVARSKNGGPQVTATVTPSQKPLQDGRGRILPTTAFALSLDIPNAAFESAARVVAELKVPEERLEVAAEVLELSDAV